MAKKNKATSSGLSPEAYIKEKARNLNIGKCWVNKDWQSIGLANIMITRVHPQGTLTVGLYLVDTYCRGIYDSYFRFSIDTDQLDELHGVFERIYGDDWVDTDYATVHNIILGAEQYAEELGIKPCKEWAVTQYLLEEDTDDIPLMEFEYGKNGRPFLCVRSGLDASRYIPLLDKSVGKGNYDVLVEADDEEYYDDDEEYYDDDEDFMDFETGPATYLFNEYNPADLNQYQNGVFCALMAFEAARKEELGDTFKQLAEVVENNEVYTCTPEHLRSLLRNALVSLDDLIVDARENRLDESDGDKVDAALLFLIIYKEAYKEVEKMSKEEIKKAIENKDLGDLLDRIDKAIDAQFEEVDRMAEVIDRMQRGGGKSDLEYSV